MSLKTEATWYHTHPKLNKQLIGRWGFPSQRVAGYAPILLISCGLALYLSMKPVWARAGIVAVAAFAGAVPLSPEWVEHYYSTGAYVALQRALTSASNALPFALLDALVVSVLVAWIALAWRDARQPRGRRGAIGRIAWRSIVWSA